ncbi:MAG: PAS domain-containing protein, partial [Pseudomonadota bacterium]
MTATRRGQGSSARTRATRSPRSKPAAQKPAAKKATPKKPATRTSTPKKSAPKKSATKKPSSKKPSSKKPAPKKSASNKSATSSPLRQRAEATEARHRRQHDADDARLSPEQHRVLLHELRVHQSELELQNEELRRAQLELEASRARYFELYDLAPVGYLTLSDRGQILEANLTAASLLGVSRSALLHAMLTRFVLPADQDIYYHHRTLLFGTGEPQSCELRLLRQGAPALWARLQGTLGHDEAGAPLCRLTFSDISRRKLDAQNLAE